MYVCMYVYTIAKVMLFVLIFLAHVICVRIIPHYVHISLYSQYVRPAGW